MNLYASGLRVDVLSNANITTTGAGTENSGNLDVQPYEGTIAITIDDRAAGTAAMTIALTMDEASGGTFATAVPDDALVDPDTGQAATFDDLSTSASTQTLILNPERCFRYVRVEFTGTDADHNIAVVASGGDKYTDAS